MLYFVVLSSLLDPLLVLLSFLLLLSLFLSLLFFNDTAPTEIYTLSLHDALPVSPATGGVLEPCEYVYRDPGGGPGRRRDRKSTRLNSSHLGISYAVFCLKKKRDNKQREVENISNSKRTQHTNGQINTDIARQHCE